MTSFHTGFCSRSAILPSGDWIYSRHSLSECMKRLMSCQKDAGYPEQGVAFLGVFGHFSSVVSPSQGVVIGYICRSAALV